MCDPLSKLKFSKALSYAFTEHGTIMAASVLNSRRAIEVRVFVVRAFVELRRAISENKELAQKMARVEQMNPNPPLHLWAGHGLLG